MSNASHSKAGSYFGSFKEPTGIIPGSTAAGYPVSGVPAHAAVISGSNANVTSDSPPSFGTGTMGANSLFQYGLFLNAAPSATQLAQGYLQFAAVGVTLATNMWLPTNSTIVNVNFNIIGATTGVGGTSTFSLGTSATNGSATFFVNGITMPAVAAGTQISTQGLAAGVYNVANFGNHVLNPTGQPTAASALNTTATVNGASLTQPVLNLTLTLNASMTGLPVTAALLVVVEYAYFGDAQNY
jgi:hypothetical protein